ncbi:MAG: Hsp20/alpha crystallin family protein [Deltaproteobacteria bacterium]|nr:Hsp20/alpha crystallin family protein [Deltaproteobacteria bacterium]
MNTQKKDRQKWVITGLVSLLAIVSIVLCGMVYHMQQQLNEIKGTGASNDDISLSDKVKKQDTSKQMKKSDSNIAIPPDLDDKWLTDNLDPDAWDPFTEMQHMQSYIDKMFSNSFGRFGKSQKYQDLVRKPAFSPQIDVRETKNAFIIDVDVPSVEKGNIDVNVDGQNVTITGTRNDVSIKKDKDGKVVQQERITGKFSRTIPLSKNVDADKMKVETQNGVFTITLPKK